MKLLLKITYDGGAFHGWQVQQNAVTVQQTMQDALEALCGRRLPVTGCSRTDAGVHAREFYCTTPAERLSASPLQQLPKAINARLPQGVAVLSATCVDDSFHPRYSCSSKEYIYEIHTGAYRDPLSVGRAWQLCRPLDLGAMNEAAPLLCGRHDFTSFCAAGSSVIDKVRTVYELRFTEQERVQMRVRADGFLYNMVRIMVGTLVQIGLGACPPSEAGRILAAKDRACAGMTAPACGLYLNRVFYDLI